MESEKQNSEKGKRIIICHGTLDAVKENYDKAVEMAGDRRVNIYMLSGRTTGNKITNGEPNCNRMDEVTDISKKGFSPTHVLCLPACELFMDRECPYFLQFGNLKYPGLGICTHRMLASHLMEVDEIIFDEDPTDCLIVEQSFDPSLLKSLGIGKQILFALIDVIKDTARRMAEFSRQNNRKGLAAYSQPMPGLEDAPLLKKFLDFPDDPLKELKSRAESLLPYYLQKTRKEESKAEWQRRLYEDGVNMHAARWLLCVLDMIGLLDFEDKTLGWAALFAGAETDKDGISTNLQLLYSLRIEVPAKPRVVVLDATASPPALQALFGRKLSVLDAQLPLPNCRWIHIQKPFGLMKAKAASENKTRSLIEIAEKQLLGRDHKILICTHKAIEKQVIEIAAKVFAGRDKIAVIHFGISRGTNEYEHFDAFILLGNFTLSPFAASRKTVTLLNDEKQSAEYIHFMNQAEDFQAINRIRPIHGNKTIIIVGRRWPDRLPRPDIVINRKSGAPKSPGGVPEPGEVNKIAEARLGGFLDIFGWLNSEAGNIMLVGRDTDIGLLELCKCWWKREIMPYVGSEQPPSLKEYIYNILYDRAVAPNLDRATAESYKGNDVDLSRTKPSILTFGSNNWFRRILKNIRSKHPDLPDLIYHHPRGGKPLRGIGTVAGVRKFYETIDQIDQFEPERWAEIGGRGKHK